MSNSDIRDARAIEQIACPRCGAPKGEECRRKRSNSRPLCCQERRTANQERLRELANAS